MLVRKDKLRASTIMAKRLLGHKKVTVRFNTVGVEVQGGDNGLMSHMVVKDVSTGKAGDHRGERPVLRRRPRPGHVLVKGQLDTDEDGYVLTKPGTALTKRGGCLCGR